YQFVLQNQIVAFVRRLVIVQPWLVAPWRGRPFCTPTPPIAAPLPGRDMRRGLVGWNSRMAKTSLRIRRIHRADPTAPDQLASLQAQLSAQGNIVSARGKALTEKVFGE